MLTRTLLYIFITLLLPVLSHAAGESVLVLDTNTGDVESSVVYDNPDGSRTVIKYDDTASDADVFDINVVRPGVNGGVVTDFSLTD